MEESPETLRLNVRMTRGRYKSWGQISGYFDGDGNVGLEVVKHVLKFKIRFVDTWRPQVEAVADFLQARGIRCGSIGNGEKRGVWQAAFRLDVVEISSVIRAARAMSRFTVKKRLDLQIVIDYLDDRITGNDAIRMINQEVKKGRRRARSGSRMCLSQERRDCG